MIRVATHDDKAGLLDLLEAIDLFPPGELAEVGNLLVQWLESSGAEDRVWLTDDDGGPRGVAYLVPEMQTDRTWNLLLIAVHPSLRGGGRGGALLRAVEEQVRARSGRMLIVETSSTGGFEGTRAFYRRHGYEEEGRIRDFYAKGDDKVVFRKLVGD